jgi:hypothetical protein
MKILPEDYRQEFYTTKTDRHKLSQPPREAYLYFPSEKEILEYNPKAPYKTIRKIFDGGVEFKEFEIKIINQFYDEIDKFNDT